MSTKEKIKHASGRRNQDTHVEATLDLESVHYGVTASWLSQVFGIQPQAIKKMLAACPYGEKTNRGQRIYALKDAAAFLVVPEIDIERHMKNLKPEDLPTKLQEGYWNAKLKRQKWEEEAGQLWRTPDVMDVLGKVFQQLKFTVQLWADQLDQASPMTAEQAATLEVLSDALLKDFHGTLVEMTKAEPTMSLLAEEEPAAEDFDDVL